MFLSWAWLTKISSRVELESRSLEPIEPEAKTLEPLPKNYPEKGSFKGEVSKDNQNPEPTNSEIQKSIEKERSYIEIKSMFPKKWVFYGGYLFVTLI